MKLLPLCLAAGCLALLLPPGGSSQDAAPQVHFVGFGPESAPIMFAADDIVRENPPTFGDTSPYASVIHLRRHVKIRTCCMQWTKPDAVHPYPPQSYLTMRADEADYHEATGEIEARGTVQITFQGRR